MKFADNVQFILSAKMIVFGSSSSTSETYFDILVPYCRSSTLVNAFKWHVLNLESYVMVQFRKKIACICEKRFIS
jgi:hypothetical protein